MAESGNPSSVIVYWFGGPCPELEAALAETMGKQGYGRPDKGHGLGQRDLEFHRQDEEGSQEKSK